MVSSALSIRVRFSMRTVFAIKDKFLILFAVSFPVYHLVSLSFVCVGDDTSGCWKGVDNETIIKMLWSFEIKLIL